MMRIERERDAAERRQASALPEDRHVGFGLVDVDVAGAMAEQSEHDRPVRRMAPAGQGQGAMERDVNAQP